MNEQYLKTRKYDLLKFWSDVCLEKSTLDLMLQYRPSPLSARKAPSERDSLDDTASPAELLAVVKKRAETELELAPDGGSGDDDLFAKGRGLGTREAAGQRVLQVATIVRNMSFVADNVAVLAKNLTCLRFCLLCCSSRWANLNQMGFDILSNVASELKLRSNAEETCVTEVLLSTLTACVSSSDRFQVISTLDVLNKLCQLEANEHFIEHEFSSQRAFFDQLVTYLSLHDMHLLTSTLECLYALSCLGENSCNAIVRSHGSVDALVSLVTVDAQSYGPRSVILMRVVEAAQVPKAPQVVPAAAQQPHAAAHQAAAAAMQAAGAQKTQALTQAQISSLTPVRPGAPGQQVIVNQQGQQVVVQQQGQQQVVVQQQQQQPQQQAPGGATTTTLIRTSTGQVIQVQRPTQPGNVVNLPRHPVPLVRPAAAASPGAAVSATTVQVQRPAAPGQQPQQPQQVVIRAVQPQGGQQQVVVQQQQQAGQGQAQQQQQTGSPLVQMRFSNDEANRNLCLSWLRATYEAAPGCGIPHDIMYKQYMASMVRKLGKRDVVSAQHHAVCVRYGVLKRFPVVMY